MADNYRKAGDKENAKRYYDLAIRVLRENDYETDELEERVEEILQGMWLLESVSLFSRYIKIRPAWGSAIGISGWLFYGFLGVRKVMCFLKIYP